MHNMAGRAGRLLLTRWAGRRGLGAGRVDAGCFWLGHCGLGAGWVDVGCFWLEVLLSCCAAGVVPEI